jgi:hypothetical protein
MTVDLVSDEHPLSKGGSDGVLAKVLRALAVQALRFSFADDEMLLAA